MPPDDIRKAEMHILAMEMAKIMSGSITAELAASERRTAERIDSVRSELSQDVKEIKNDIKLIEVSVSRVETRLDEGDKRFDAIELRLNQVEQRERITLVSIARLIGAAGAGALGIKLFGG